MLVVKGSNFVTNFLPFFKFLISSVVNEMKSVDQLAQNWFILNFFNSLGFIDFILTSFLLYLYWTYIFLAKKWY